MSEEKWKMNEAKDGIMPCCKKCGKAFADGDIGDVKNYPEDGVVAVFFKCESCGEESDFTYVPLAWMKKDELRLSLVKE